MKTRICKNGHNCVHGPKPLPLNKEYFWTDKRAAGGFRDTCKACSTAKMLASKKALKEADAHEDSCADTWNDEADPIGRELQNLQETMTARCIPISQIPEGESILLKIKGIGQGSRAAALRGRLVGKYKSIFTVDFGTYRESFLIADLICGQIELEAVGQG